MTLQKAGSSPDLERARACYERGAWSEAFHAFSRADRDPALRAEDLERMAMAAHLIGREDDFVGVMERAHDAYLDAGEPLRATRCAFWMGLRLASRGQMGPATGWLGRARRLLEREDGICVEQGYLLLPTGQQQLGSGEYEAAYRTGREAAEIGERFDDADLVALGIHLQGRARLGSARLDEGLALLDEAMVAVASRRLSPHVTGLIYCSVIGACRSVYALRRAHDWTAALSAWCERQPDMVPYSGECLVYRAEIMQLHGAWESAAEEAARARERFDHGGDAAGASAALYRQGEVHRLRGEFEKAEQAFRAASRLGREPQPGLALLRLARGETETAAAGIRRVLSEARDPMKRARLLPAYVEIMLAAGESEDARGACRELEGIAQAYRTEALETLVAESWGVTLLADGDAEAALVWLRKAWQGWQSLEAPHDAARVRVSLGEACRALGDDDGARLELEAARSTFEGLGAAPDLDRIDSLTRTAPRGAGHGLTPREMEVLASLATGKTNRAIAADLFISEKTVARHVSSIFSKLGVRTRAAATAYAYEHDLL